MEITRTEQDDTELDAWLGGTATTTEQRTRLVRVMRAVDERWPDPDLEDTRREAINAAAQLILGDTTLGQVADAWHHARTAERDAHAALTGALLASDGTEVELARQASTTRATVRKARGKYAPVTHVEGDL